MPNMEDSPYFNSVREIYESGREVINFDDEFRVLWEDKDYQGLLRCHFVDKGRYEIELILPGVVLNSVADQLGDGREKFFCAFLPPAYYD
jgi:hypothetical protein